MWNKLVEMFQLRIITDMGNAEDQPLIPLFHMAESGGQPPKRTIRGQRRRPGSDQPSSGRAEAPTRDDRPSGSYGGGGMSGIPGGTRGAAGGGGLLLAICGIIAYMLFGGGVDRTPSVPPVVSLIRHRIRRSST